MSMDWMMQYYFDVSSSQLTYRFNTIPVRNPENYFMGISKLILKFILEGKGPEWLTNTKEEKSWSA